MPHVSPVRVFIGSGEASLLERKAMIYSLRKNTRRSLDVYVFNGTHNAVELNGQPPILVPLPLNVKYRNFTEFSNYRWIIPQLCNYQGRAIYVDSDMLCLQDIGELFDQPMHGYDLLAKAESYQGEGSWGLSVMLIDCAKCRFDVKRYFEEIDQGCYTNADLHQFLPAFLKHHPFQVGSLDPNWNVFDYCDQHTKLIHYTNLLTQPWKHAGHPYGDLWFQYFHDAIDAGVITQQDIETTKLRSYVRQDIMQGNNPCSKPPRAKRLRKKISGVMRKLSGRRKAA